MQSKEKDNSSPVAGARLHELPLRGLAVCQLSSISHPVALWPGHAAAPLVHDKAPLC